MGNILSNALPKETISKDSITKSQMHADLLEDWLYRYDSLSNNEQWQAICKIKRRTFRK